MKAMLHGYRRVDMVDQDRQIHGYSVFVGYPSSGVQGQETAKQWISDEVAAFTSWSPEIGEMINLDFTPKGKVCGVAAVHEK